MRLLPTSLWLLVAARIEAQEQLRQLPTAVRKMNPDQGEKFLHEYAAFADAGASPQAALLADTQEAPPLAVRRLFLYSEGEARRLAANSSAELAFRPPFAPHVGAGPEENPQDRLQGDDEAPGRRWHAREMFRRAASALAILQGRQWACPDGTTSCANIGFPNSCCSSGETCVEITDTGLGSVGCCPAGSTCGGSIGNCAPGNTPCASDIGGGCCIPGFVCQGVGCVRSSAPVVTMTSTTTTVINSPTPSTVVTTVIITVTPSNTGPVTTQTSTKFTTASQTSSPSVTTGTDSGVLPPVRPTSTSGTDTGSNTFCPTGFYPCLASAGGGCCQTGRDCQTTSCPPIEYTTVINTDGVTVVVPASAVPTPTTTGQCADNWFMCGKEAGAQAGCCPSGYNCGTASCFLATAGATASVAKQLPNRADKTNVHWKLSGAVLVAVVSWLVL